MKNIMLATVALTAMVTMASAGDRPTIVGYSEYAVEAQSFEAGVGTELLIGNKLLVTPMVSGSGSGEDFAFDHAEVKAKSGLNENVDLYGKITTDSDLNYAETTIGVAFQF